MTMQDGRYLPITQQNGHVLLVDDEAPIRKLISDVLRPRGYTVTQCCGGSEAVEYYSRHAAEVDLVVMDIMMPGMNGTEALARMLLIDPSVRVIMISGGRYSEDELRAAGAIAFAPKPFGIPQLLGLVKQHIRRELSPEIRLMG
jgi:CheY-like chemotaxis protein